MKFNKKKTLIVGGIVVLVLVILFWSYISAAVGITGNSVRVVG